MDYQTAHKFILNQGNVVNSSTDTLLKRLREGKPPVPGQVTNILLALKILFEKSQDATSLERQLCHSLFLLAYESRRSYESGRKAGVNWPPLLDEDIKRIAKAVEAIFSGVWSV